MTVFCVNVFFIKTFHCFPVFFFFSHCHFCLCSSCLFFLFFSIWDSFSLRVGASVNVYVPANVYASVKVWSQCTKSLCDVSGFPPNTRMTLGNANEFISVNVLAITFSLMIFNHIVFNLLCNKYRLCAIFESCIGNYKALRNIRNARGKRIF